MKFSFLSGILKRLSYKSHMQEINAIRQNKQKLDQRLDKVMRATLNGESEWFIEQLSQKDPECVLRIIKECGDHK